MRTGLARHVSAPQIVSLITLALLAFGCSLIGPSPQEVANQTAIAGIQASLSALNDQRTATQAAGVTMVAQATQKVEATRTARADASATAAAILTATAQQALSEANAPAGWKLIFYDPFENNDKRWPEGKDDINEFNHSNIRVEEGKYLWTEKSRQGFVQWGLPSNISRVNDFYVMVDGKLESGEPSTGYGIIVRYDRRDLYEFEVNEQGYWNISVLKSDIWNWLKGGRSGQIVSGGIHLAVNGAGSNYVFYVNGAEVARVTDDRVNGDGVGVIFEMGFRGAEATVSFDNFTVLVPR